MELDPRGQDEYIEQVAIEIADYLKKNEREPDIDDYEWVENYAGEFIANDHESMIGSCWDIVSRGNFLDEFDESLNDESIFTEVMEEHWDEIVETVSIESTFSQDYSYNTILIYSYTDEQECEKYDAESFPDDINMLIEAIPQDRKQELIDKVVEECTLNYNEFELYEDKDTLICDMKVAYQEIYCYVSTAEITQLYAEYAGNK